MNGIKLKIEYNIKFGRSARDNKKCRKKKINKFKTKLTQMTKCNGNDIACFGKGGGLYITH